VQRASSVAGARYAKARKRRSVWRLSEMPERQQARRECAMRGSGGRCFGCGGGQVVALQTANDERREAAGKAAQHRRGVR